MIRRHPHPLLLLALLAVTGCRLGPGDWDTWKENADQDQDGFPPEQSGGADCNDRDPDTRPGAPERCNGKDDDCDGDVDEPQDLADGLAFYQDLDADGYGTDAAMRTACEAPEGFAAETGDCDDRDAAIHPGATETTGDGQDQDCDGMDACYADTDGDGFRTDDTVGSADPDCDDAGEARASDPSGDCDDNSGSVFPGATEIVGDEVDQDCDGMESCYTDADADGYRSTYSYESADTDCDDAPEASADVTSGDCSDSHATIHPGATEVTGDGVDQDCDGRETCYRDMDGDGARATSTIASSDTDCGDAGEALTSAEVDCDDSDGDTRPGAAEVCGDAKVNDCDGSEAEALEECLTGEFPLVHADATFTGEYAGDNAGASLGSVGDVTGDGQPDLLVGATGFDPNAGAMSAGALYLLKAPMTTSLDLSSAEATLWGEGEGDSLGVWFSGSGDLDGDGLNDVVGGANGSDAAAINAGAAYVFLGPVRGDQYVTAADGTWTGVTAADAAGFAVSILGDMNGDGFDELLVGAPNATAGVDQPGAVWIVPGPATGEGNLAALVKLTGEADGDTAGFGLSPSGDVDGDGLDDVLVGAPGADGGGADAGAAYLVLAPVSADLDLGDADAILTGEAAGDQAGFTVATAGDVDGDGYHDVILGAPLNDNAATSAGCAYLVLGDATLRDRDLSAADAAFRGEDSTDQAGYTVAAAGDVDADGQGDLLVTAPLANTAGYASGTVYLLLGPHAGKTSLGTAETWFTGEGAGDNLVTAAGAGDLDRDGYDDIAIGAVMEDSGGADAGLIYVIHTSATW